MTYPYFNQWNQYPTPQPSGNQIHNISSVISTTVQCFYVNSPQDMDKINPSADTLYIGINLSAKEVYLKQLNGLGLIDVDTYVKSSGEQQKNDITKILDKLDEIMKGKDNAIQSTTNSSGNEYVQERNVAQSSDHAAV